MTSIGYSITTVGWGEPMEYFVASIRYINIEMPITYILPILIMVSTFLKNIQVLILIKNLYFLS